MEILKYYHKCNHSMKSGVQSASANDMKATSLMSAQKFDEKQTSKQQIGVGVGVEEQGS